MHTVEFFYFFGVESDSSAISLIHYYSSIIDQYMPENSFLVQTIVSYQRVTSVSLKYGHHPTRFTPSTHPTKKKKTFIVKNFQIV